MKFADIHCHALFATDDGPKSEKDMFTLIDAMYKDNIRDLCLTPHFHPGYFGENIHRAEKAFDILKRYVNEVYPDLNIYFGNELRYNMGCENWLKEGICKTLNSSRFVLVDFSENQPLDDIIKGTQRILNAGYVPVLAHVERYRKIPPNLRPVFEMKQHGVVIQIDAQSVVGFFGFISKKKCKRLLEMNLVDIVATDAHGANRRPPAMTECYEYIKKNYGENYAQRICRINPLEILNDRYKGRN